MAGHISHNFAGILIKDAGTDRDFNGYILAPFAGTVPPLPILSPLGPKGFLDTVIYQGVKIAIRQQINITAITAITAIRATVGNILLPPKTDATIAAVTRDHHDGGLIYEFHENSPSFICREA